MSGWIKLHRKLLGSPIFDNPDLLKVWLWCLLKSSHRGYVQMVGLVEVELNEGQFVTGRNKGSSELKINPSTFYKYLKVLEKNQMIALNSNNKMTIVTVVNWALYQGKEDEMYQQNNNKITTKEQQNNTNKNDKNDKNDKKNNYIDIVIQEYKDKLHLLPQPQKITPKRIKHINARIEDYDLETVMDVLDKVSKSDFLLGKVNKWKADIDWIFNPNNFVKILEGKYSNKENKETDERRTGVPPSESVLGEREVPFM